MIIDRDKSVIPACDVSLLEKYRDIVRETSGVEGIEAYKVGFELGLAYGLRVLVNSAHNHGKKVIYDHQKAGTDIPEMGENFASVCSNAGVDAVILFPQAGPETEKAWISAAQDRGLGVIVGGRMTHKAYAQSEGGWISDEGAMDMYRIAAQMGVRDFVVPGNKPDVIREIRNMVVAKGIDPVLYAPGFIAQGGNISDSARIAGDKFHGIVGRGIYQADDINAAALELTSQI